MKLRLLHKKLKALVGEIQDKKLRRKVVELLEDPVFEVNGKEFSGIPLNIAPAGLSRHHCYPGGYIEHVVSTANVAIAMCNSVKNVYRGKVNRDLVIAGVLLHDVFKPATYTMNENGSFSSSRLADFLDHLSIAVAELVRRDFPLELIHIVSAHHGDYGPIRPHSIEALICHLADFADSRLNGKVMDAASYLTRKSIGHQLRGLSSEEAFELVHSKTIEGWEGVVETVEKMKQKRSMQKT